MVFQLVYFLSRPVEIVSYVGYLLFELDKRVAFYSPVGTNSTSNSWLQLGHFAGMAGMSASLILL